MGKERSLQNLAKLLAYVLGRRPDEFGLVPEAGGWVKVKDLLKALHEEAGWGYVNPSHLNAVRLSVAPPPVEMAEGRIRARDRGALEGLGAGPAPPKLLYACVRRRAYPHVLAEGLLSSAHYRIVLAADLDMARRIGRRRDSDPVLLTVNVERACAAGALLTAVGEGLYTADRLPPGSFSGPPLRREKAAEAEPQKPQRRQPAGGFLLDPAGAAPGPVPASLRRGAVRGPKIDRRRLKQGRWSRNRPPWKE